MEYSKFIEECEYFNINPTEVDVYVTSVHLAKNALNYITNIRAERFRLVPIEDTPIKKRFDEKHALQFYGKRGKLVSRYMSVYPKYNVKIHNNFFLSETQAKDLLYKQLMVAQKEISKYLALYQAKYDENSKTLREV